MRKLLSALSGACLLLAYLLCASAAHAQATRTWVSGVGDDVNPCSRTAPCKTFAGAISKTKAGGEISVLDPGGFGAVTITKSISIVNDYSGEAGILASGISGVTVNAGPNDVVILRGLVIDGAPPTTPSLNGIRFIAGGALYVQKCLIKNFTSGSAGNGILFAPAGAASLYLSQTMLVNNGGPSVGGGIVVKPTGSGATKVVIENVQSMNNSAGIVFDASSATGGIRAGIRQTVVGGSIGTGMVFTSKAGGGAIIAMLDRVASYANGANGYLSDGPPTTVVIGNSSAAANGLLGFATSNSGTLLSYGTNQIGGNFGGDGSPTGPIAPK